MTYAVILNYNSWQESLILYTSLVELSRPDLKVIVLDNNSSETDKNHLERNIPAGDFIQNKQNLGYAGGNNVGVKKALEEGAEYIWILNPDIRITTSSLEILINSLEKNPKLAAVGPRIRSRENPDLIFTDGENLILDKECRTFHLNYNVPFKDIAPRINFDIDYIDGSSIFIRSQALLDIGIFSEHYFLYFEETDWCLRARSKGWKIAINSNAEVFNITSEKGKLFHFYMNRNRLILCKKYHPDFRSVLWFHAKKLFEELMNRIKGEAYLKPYYFARCKGFLAGLIKSKLTWT
ncbi:glycosyltransferase family 2 protein [Christiangramia echinicola]|uniref:Glycosyltransferase 2-like domain-containing protein n=1 Tax=Christiangramia echinicola TaxID=279359 RepID=A0A1H1L4D8_9FLAO|nr:glycosyltransferase family 2 protein [Christiangramia echinicola]SDR69142.1 hypothetical protein SAMN04488552_0536 [Christiangramia echinicola]